ncbi:MAG: hypothetical protein HY830_27090 [Actinobacteria bacterium]|nr:hypothetical protein [Actinomycetota bacterium]
MSLDVVPGPATSEAGDEVAAAAPGPRRVPVPWGTVVALAVLVSLADVFLVVSLQGAVGSIERAQGPFALWLEVSALVLPFQVGAVLLALRIARRRVGPSIRTLRTLAVAGALVVATTSVVGAGALVANAARDYQFQASEADRMAYMHHGSATVAGAAAAAATPGRNDATCVGPCHAKRATLRAHARGIAHVAPFVVLANLVVVGWVVAMAGGSLDASPRRRRPATA